MKLKMRIAVFMAVLLASSAGIFGVALAATPTLSTSQTGVSNVVRVTISAADPNSIVSLYQQQGNGNITSINNFGQTDFLGNFSQMASLVTDGSSSQINMWVIINGFRSNTVAVFPGGGTCNFSCNTGAITLSQNNLSLFTGQNATVNITNNFSGFSYFISSNSNSSVASANISGNSINVFANSTGSTNIVVCQNGSFQQCATLFVTVNSGGSNTGSLTFGTSNPSLFPGQSFSTSIFSNNLFSNNGYYVSNNSNSNVVSANVAGSTLNLNAINSGSSTITICQFGFNACGSVFVTVSGTGTNTGFTLGQTNVALNYGQSMTVPIYTNNTYSTYTVSSNSNPTAVQATISGSTINLYGQNIGSSTLVICQGNTYYSSFAQCQNLFVQVGGFNSGYGSGFVTFNNTNPSLAVGQSLSVAINTPSYSGFTVSSNSNISVVGATISGSTLFLNGNAAGTSTITVCQSGSSNCGSVFVTVTGFGGSVLGASQYANGTLISEGGTIYQVYKNTKVGFANYAAFVGLGYSLNNVTNVGFSGLGQASFVVTSSNIPHPWGTWIKSGNTVYFVDQNGLIPIADYNVFINNGGQDRLVVLSNSFDSSRPIESLMTFNDARLR